MTKRDEQVRELAGHVRTLLDEGWSEKKIRAVLDSMIDEAIALAQVEARGEQIAEKEKRRTRKRSEARHTSGK